MCCLCAYEELYVCVFTTRIYHLLLGQQQIPLKIESRHFLSHPPFARVWGGPRIFQPRKIHRSPTTLLITAFYLATKYVYKYCGINLQRFGAALH